MSRSKENFVQHNRAALVLAGGDGTRLRSLTKLIVGTEVPKQFCTVTGDRTLLEDTLERTALAVPRDHTVVVVNREHRPHYMPILEHLEPHQIVEQPCNRGTAPAIFYGIRRLLELDSEAIAAILPSDHFVGNDRAFMRHVEAAFEAVNEFPQLCVVLGIQPRTAETSYGWIEPADRISFDRPDLFRVKRFREKPDAPTARRLFKAGCLWNSFILVASVRVLYSMFAEFAPGLFCTFNAELAESNSDSQVSAIERIYDKLPTLSFSDQVLTQCPPNLAVLKTDHPDWSDLGEPARVLEAVSNMNQHPRWLEALVNRTGKTMSFEAQDVAVKSPAGYCRYSYGRRSF